MKFALLLLFALSVVANTACKKEAVEDGSLVQYNMTTVTGSNTAAVNQPVLLTVSYRYSNGCQVIDTFKQEAIGNVIFIKAFGHFDKSAFCTQDAGTKFKVYTFTSSSKGTFGLRFTNIDNSFISHTITVN
jgi:hypothetical protein